MKRAKYNFIHRIQTTCDCIAEGYILFSNTCKFYALYYVVRMRITLLGINATGCKNLSAFKIVAGHETLFCRPLRQLLVI